MVFEPIVRLGASRSLFAVEAFVRVPATFDLAQADALLGQDDPEALRRSSLRAVLRAGAALPGSLDLAVNLAARALVRSDGAVADLLDEAKMHRLAPSRLLVDLHDVAGVANGRQLARAVVALRASGVRVCVDGVVAGSLPKLRALVPDFVKLDGRLLRGTDQDPARRRRVEQTVDLARQLEARLVAEGVKNAGELAFVRGLGVELVQGPHLAAPMALAELVRHPLVVAALRP